MAGPNVQVTLSAADAGLVRAWTEARRQGPDAYEKSLAKVKGASRTLRSEIDSMIGGAIARYATLEVAISKVADVTRRAIEMQLELRKARNDASTTQEEANARFLNQTQRSGLTVDQRIAIANAAGKTATLFGSSDTEGRGMATQLASAGVTEGEINPFMVEAFKFATAQGQPLDSQLLAALVEQTRANDDKVRADTLRQVTEAMFGLQETSLTPEQLIPFSKTNIGLKAAGMSVKEQLAMDATTLDIYSGDASQAATFNRAFVSKLRAPDKASSRALQQLVGNTGNVDFIGESMSDVLDRLAKGLEKVDERKRVPLLTQVFGQEYGAQAAELIGRRGIYGTNVGRAGAGGSLLDESAARLMNTNAAQQRAATAGVESAKAKWGSPEAETVRKRFLQVMEERGINAIAQWYADAGVRLSEAINPSESREEALQRVEDSIGGGASGAGRDIRRAVEAKLDIDLLKQINDQLKTIAGNTADKGVVIEGDETTNAKRRGTPAKAPLSGVGGR